MYAFLGILFLVIAFRAVKAVFRGVFRHPLLWIPLGFLFLNRHDCGCHHHHRHHGW